MIWLSTLLHVLALSMGLFVLHRYSHLFKNSRCRIGSIDVVEITYLTVCASTIICPVAVYDLMMTAAGKSAISDLTMVYLVVSGGVIAAFHLISLKTMEQVDAHGCRWRIL